MKDLHTYLAFNTWMMDIYMWGMMLAGGVYCFEYWLESGRR